jgi:hypothetical protein
MFRQLTRIVLSAACLLQAQQAPPLVRAESGLAAFWELVDAKAALDKVRRIRFQGSVWDARTRSPLRATKYRTDISCVCGRKETLVSMGNLTRRHVRQGYRFITTAGVLRSIVEVSQMDSFTLADTTVSSTLRTISCSAPTAPLLPIDPRSGKGENRRILFRASTGWGTTGRSAC